MERHFLKPWLLAKTSSEHAFLGPMAQGLPHLLSHLCRETTVLSLERMQLVDMTVTIHAKSRALHASYQNIAIKNVSKDKLLLSGDLQDLDQHILSLSIGYFLRGEHQFFRSKPMDFDWHKTDITVQESDIKTFFKSINSENSFFYDQKLAKLNGRPMLLIPTHMIVTLFLMNILSHDPRAETYRHFYFMFHTAVFVNNRLALGQAQNINNNYFGLFQNDECAVTVQVR